MYNLLFVDGINAIDSYAFRNEQDQRDFFENAIVVSIDEYYPPHYSNRIRLSTDIVPLSTNFNYLSLEFDNKYYYYFITGIKYINEVVYEIEIEMDTIQTLMFNTYFLNLKVDRMSINRWDYVSYLQGDKVINREYVRENISEEDYDLKEYQQIKSDFAFLLIQVSEYHGNYSNVSSPRIDYENYSNRRCMTDGLIYYLLPIPLDDSLLISYYKIGTHTIPANVNAIRETIQHAISSPYTVNVYLLNNAYVCQGIEYSVDSLVCTFSSGDIFKIDPDANPIWYQYQSPNDWENTPAFRIASFNPKWLDKTVINPLNILDVNTSLNRTFSINYIPYLLDENYVDFEYGERMKTTHYPLHQLKYPDLRQFFKFDINTCARSYKMDAITDFDTQFNDSFITTVVVDTSPNMPLITDSWLDYYCRNKANYSDLGVSTNLANIGWGSLTSFGLNSARSNITGQSMRNSGFTQIMNAVDISNPQGINTGANTMLNGHMWSSFGGLQAKVGLANAAVQTANYSVDFDLAKMNASYTPDTYTAGKQPFNDVFCKSNEIIYKLSVVRDIENVARRIEYYGYKVNKYIHNTNGILLSQVSELFQRYYYNVIQLSECSLKFNMFVADDLKHNLLARLRAGIRLFSTYYTNTSIGDSLRYDNVEKDFIQNP